MQLCSFPVVHEVENVFDQDISQDPLLVVVNGLFQHPFLLFGHNHFVNMSGQWVGQFCGKSRHYLIKVLLYDDLINRVKNNVFYCIRNKILPNYSFVLQLQIVVLRHIFNCFLGDSDTLLHYDAVQQTMDYQHKRILFLNGFFFVSLCQNGVNQVISLLLDDLLAHFADCPVKNVGYIS